MKYKELYHFEVVEAIANNKRVNCIDKRMETVQLVNAMSVQQYLSITNHEKEEVSQNKKLCKVSK